MDLLLHIETTRTLCLFAMDALTEGLVVAHRHSCYVYVPDLLWRQQSKPLKKCIIYVTGMKMGLEMKQQHFILLVKMVNWCGCQQICRRMLAVCLCMCRSFPTKMMEQTIVTS